MALTLFHRLQKPLIGLLTTLGLTTVAVFPYFPVMGAEVKAPQSTGRSTAHPSLPDGTYLYGQSAQPDQIGSAYMVFTVNHDQVVGAFYMPYSSFDCFQGEFQADQLALTIVDSYDQTSYPYAVALQPVSAIASSQAGTSVPVSLQGFHRLPAVSANDQRILATCQADFRGQHKGNPSPTVGAD